MKSLRKPAVSGVAAKVVIAILGLIILMGCAKKDAIKQMSEEDSLRERVEAYWAHNIKETFDKSYEYEYPLYRKNVSMVEYLRNINNSVQWTKVEISRIAIENGTADVTIIMDTKIKALPIVTKSKGGADLRGLQKTEKWIKVEGSWYHVPKSFRAD